MEINISHVMDQTMLFKLGATRFILGHFSFLSISFEGVDILEFQESVLKLAQWNYHTFYDIV